MKKGYSLIIESENDGKLLLNEFIEMEEKDEYSQDVITYLEEKILKLKKEYSKETLTYLGKDELNNFIFENLSGFEKNNDAKIRRKLEYIVVEYKYAIKNEYGEVDIL